MNAVVELVRTSSGARPLSEISGDPPPPLIVDRLDPEGHTILYGTGGVGKGTLTASWIVRLVGAGHRVLILDYENHPGEWRRRVDGLGGSSAVAGVHWSGPLTASWRGSRGAIWRQERDLAQLVADLGTTYLVIDSIVFACAGTDPMKPETAARYAGALEYLDVPVLSLAHVTKAEDLRYPFGSAFWHNGARTTWSLKRDGERAILAHQKHNNYASLGRFVVETTWIDNQPREIWERGYTVVLADRIDELLEVSPGLTHAEIVDALNDADDGEPVKSESVRKALQRGAKGDPSRWVASDGRWSPA